MANGLDWRIVQTTDRPGRTQKKLKKNNNNKKEECDHID